MIDFFRCKKNFFSSKILLILFRTKIVGTRYVRTVSMSGVSRKYSANGRWFVLYGFLKPGFIFLNSASYLQTEMDLLPPQFTV